MTDVKSWVEERRATHAAATEHLYFQHWGGQNQNGDYAESILFDERDGEELTRGLPDADGEAFVDAHNMFPRALDALNAVLELHASDMLYENVDRCENYNEYHVDDFHTESEDGVEICMGRPTGVRVCRSCQADGEPVDWPCATVQAIEGAINE
ncbi:hypothetical protein ACU4IU_00390 [Brevibacterium sp. CSND-B09]|uniref:hypothetical protein n=1 Tax=Brevibacterium sp. CSND-B09 TaxID=3462571 RepID=UPI00406A6B60